MEAAGATIIEISLPHARFALPAYYIIVSSEISSNLARYDGIRYGFRPPARLAETPAQRADEHDADRYESLLDVYERTRAEGFGVETKRRIMLGTYALSAGYYDAYYLKAQRVRRLIQDDFTAAFSRVDVIAGPTTPSPAFKRGEHTMDPLSMYLADIYTVAVNLAGLPAISLPAGVVAREGISLPIGLQLIAARNHDYDLFDYARLFERMV
jgi:aspartyl-tRNA(Asn)/glutamyl-tRNA(Gln) amidotransferase subunit A